MKTTKQIFLGCLLIGTVLGACKKDDNNNSAQTLYGAAVSVGADSIRSFVDLDANAQPVNIGLLIGEDALKNLPTDTMPGMPNYMYILKLPEQAKISGIDHIEADWNPFGHIPTAVYGVPHFDFHFYYITETEQGTIVGGPEPTPIDKKFIPKDYFTPAAVAVPYMGVHLFDSTATEFHGQPFTSTFIYGFYKGNFTFVEPMITKTFLETHPDFSADIKQPQAFQKTGYNPTSYSIKYDASKRVLKLSLSGLIKH